MASSGLRSADLKFIRATEHIQAVKDCVASYRSTEPYEIIPQPNGEEKLHITKPPPIEISILAGEAIYQIRSALDHLVFELVKRNPSNIMLPARWEEKCGFPMIRALPPNVSTPPIPNGQFAKMAHLYGVAAAPLTFIEALQPYYRYPAGMRELAVISELSNIDKHRHMHLTVVRVQRSEHVIAKRDGSVIGPALYQFPLDHGAQFKRLIPADELPPGDVEVKRQFVPYVAFDEATIQNGTKMWATSNVEWVLEMLLNFAHGYIGLAFEQFLRVTPP